MVLRRPGEFRHLRRGTASWKSVHNAKLARSGGGSAR